ncbi:MAG: hypothetical protein CL610_30330 [Anaerolineaceae bacterium]|nr:hypothetical protein [Anaerolineaceae bacterium]
MTTINPIDSGPNPAQDRTRRTRLVDDWQVCPVAPEDDRPPEALFADAAAQVIHVPDSCHLQPTLYPDRPYWGSHLRAINQQDWLYRRVFIAPEDSGKRTRLRFEGVDYFADVWLNGAYVGQHEGNFVPFEFDITVHLRPGVENVLFVRVRSPWDAPNPKGTYPLDHVLRGLVKGLYEHGEGVIPPDVNPIGIWRPVWLIHDDGIHIDHVQINTQLDGSVDVRLRVINATGAAWAGHCDLMIRAHNHDGPGVDQSLPLQVPEGTHEQHVTLHIPEPRLWWPWDHGLPNLYDLTASLYSVPDGVVSRTETRFGVRTVFMERTAQRFTCFINEHPIFLRGSAYIPGLYLSQITADRLRDDVELARDANLNLLRVHVHVCLPELYQLCDELGVLVWQDFELNWVHEASLAFEQRARRLQHAMIEMLFNHPSIMAWACHNEPTMRLARRANLEQHPDPALYADAVEQDPSRVIFLCSGHQEEDWLRSGDSHTYYGAIWSRQYTDVYDQQLRLNSEFGFEAPAALSTLQAEDDVWQRLQHLEGQIDTLWRYQAELIKFHVEHLRRLRATCSAGYVHFWLVDLVPQVGCGVVDAHRQKKMGYETLREASQPLHVMLEHNGRRPFAIWVLNDLLEAFSNTTVRWQVFDAHDRLLLENEAAFDVAPNAAQRVQTVRWDLPATDCARVVLTLQDHTGHVLAANTYDRPFQPLQRPAGYPWKFDPYLGVKVFDYPDAPSLADVGTPPLLRRIPLFVRERATEFVLRQQFPVWLASSVARLVDRL